MLACLSKFILRCAGWKVFYDIPDTQRRFVLIMAPHTSNWDFVIGRLALWAIRVKAYFLIKKEAFFFPLGVLIRHMGGIPVDRSHSNNVVLEISEMFCKKPDMVIAITPEGTRSLRKEWKRGYWYIASHAKVPVVMAYLDYRKKIAGVHKMFWPSPKFEHDQAMIDEFYSQITAKFPEKFNLSPMYRNAINR